MGAKLDAQIDSLRLAKMQDKLADFDAKTRSGVVRVYRENGQAAIRDLKRTPAQPSRTRAKTFNTYVRGVGNYPRAAFGATRLRPGAHQGRFGRIRYTSEKLGSQWEMEVSQSSAQVTLGIHNAASYAGWVQGELQTRWHRLTGWTRLPDVVAKTYKAIVQDLREVIRMWMDE